METIDLRKRAARKFSLASRMFFMRDALEQATGETVSAYCATRFAAFSRVADLGCGIGGDTIALAKVTRVGAIDRDPPGVSTGDHQHRNRFLPPQNPPPRTERITPPRRRPTGNPYPGWAKTSD